MCTKRIFGAACCTAAVILPCTLVILGEMLLPGMILSSLHDTLVHDTIEKVYDWCDPNGLGSNISATLTVFNLTNAKELQRVNPAPKPHFEAVEVEFTMMVKSFKCSMLEEGELIHSHEWVKWVPSNPETYSWEFVQVNPVYLSTVGMSAPSEAMLLVGMSHLILGSVKEVMDGYGGGVLMAYPAAASALGAMMSETLSTPQDVGAAQFGVSGITNLVAAQALNLPVSSVGFTSVASDPAMGALGVCTPIELSAYMNDVTSGPFAPSSDLALALLSMGLEFTSFSMSVAEAQAFLARFSDATLADLAPFGAPNWAAVLLTLVMQHTAAVMSGDSSGAAEAASRMHSTTDVPGNLFAPTFGTFTVTHKQSGSQIVMCSSSAGGDLCPVVAAAYATYLASYLPERFYIGCSLLGCADDSCMRDDGTYPKNSGLFTRLTLYEMLHDGNADALFATAPPDAEYNGLLGKHAHMNATLDVMLRELVDLTPLSKVQRSGKSDVVRLREWVSMGGRGVVKIGDVGYPGWGTDGTPGEPFELAGMRSAYNMAPQTKTPSPWVLASDEFKLEPNFGTSIDYFAPTLQRPLTLDCGGISTDERCEFTKLKETIHAKKYTLSDEMLKTKSAGTPSDSCRGSVSARFAATYPGTMLAGPTCDFLQRHDGVINMAVASGGAPVAMTLGYLGGTNASVRDAVSITMRSGTTQIYYNRWKDEMAIDVEPMTGAVMKGTDRMQSNWYIEKTMLDSKRYANIFSGDTDNGDVFVWPFVYIKQEFSIDEEGAKTFAANVYEGFNLGYFLDQLGIFTFVICMIVAGTACLWHRCANVPLMVTLQKVADESHQRAIDQDRKDRERKEKADKERQERKLKEHEAPENSV